LSAAAPDPAAAPVLVVVMGVSGSGKSAVARALADRLGWDFTEGDSFHPAANVEAMAAGRPLTDEDRWPWLRRIVEWLAEEAATGRPAVITCSALRRAYRDALRAGVPASARLVFCELRVPPDVLADRMSRRTGHFMPASLLPSQLATLEPLEPDEPGVIVDADGSPEDVVERVATGLGLDRG